MDDRERTQGEPVSPDPAQGASPEREPAGRNGAAASDAAAGAGPAAAAEPLAVEEEPAELLESGGEFDDIAIVSAQRDEYLALAQRTKADFENYRKRMSREARVAESRGVGRLVKELLPALDNLERAISHATEDDPLLEGIRLVHADFASALGRVGVESYSPVGEPFDPAEHEAMAQLPVDGAASGTVVEVYQPGYRLDGNLLRPARVVVAA
jgi:molecular chaperone GrpE